MNWTSKHAHRGGQSIVAAPVLINMIAGTLLIWVSPGAVQAADPGWSTGNKNVLYMRAVFPDAMDEPISQSAATAHMEEVSSWFESHSYGLLGIEATVTPLLILPQNKSWYAAESPIKLLEDARTVASSAGFNPFDFDLDIVRHTKIQGPSWNFGGTSSVGKRNLWLQETLVSLTIHELGHNFGLGHSDGWLANDETIVGPGVEMSYGNVFDIMGIPAADPEPYTFNVVWMNRLGWLPDTAILEPLSGGIFRLWAFDASQIATNRLYAIKVRSSSVREYWMEFRQRDSANPLVQNGLIFNRSPWFASLGDTQLLDMTPATANDLADAPLQLGKTFSDFSSGLHITPIAVGSELSERWMDVNIQLGNKPSNHIPIVSIDASQVTANSGEQIGFTATAMDLDAASLAYHWDFGNGRFGTNGPTASHSWNVHGEYLVRCTVTDLVGGRASDSIIVTVGSPSTLRITGNVLQQGEPVEGAHISSSLGQSTHTDSDGNFTLTGVTPGEHMLTAIAPGRTLTDSGFGNPVSIGNSDVSGINFLSTANLPAFDIEPQSESADQGDDILLYVAVSGIAPIHLQWQKDGIDIPDETNEVLIIPSVGTFDAGSYSVVASNSAGTNSSQAALVSVSDAPRIVTQPASQIVNVGKSVTFLVEVTGSEPLTYVWYYNDNFLAPGGNTYTITSTTLDDQGTYSVLVLNSAGQVRSASAELTVNRLPIPNAPVINRLVTRRVKAPATFFSGTDLDGDPVTLLSAGPDSSNGGSVTIRDGWVLYAPPPASNSPDTFSFAVSDGKGGSANGTAMVNVVNDESYSTNYVVELISEDEVRVTFDGIPGRTYAIDYTEILTPPAWQSLGNIAADSNGRLIFNHTLSAGSPERIYRVTRP